MNPSFESLARIAEWINQLVIIGAGLDARAYRFDELKKIKVFEGIIHACARAYSAVPADHAAGGLGRTVAGTIQQTGQPLTTGTR
jgi:hypothetical protein